MAATVIDELVITLGLDPSKLNKGQKDAIQAFKKTRDEAAKSAKDLEASGQRAAEGFYGKIKSEALGLFAVLVGAGSIEKFVANTVTGLTSVSNAANAVGLSVRPLQAWGMVIEMMGGDAKAAKQEMVDLAKTLEAWNTLGIDPGANFWMALNAVGGSTKDSPQQLFDKLAKYAETQPDKAKVNQFARYLGFTQDADTVEALKGQAAVLEDLRVAMDKVPSDQQIDKIKAAGVAWRELGQTIHGALQKIVAAPSVVEKIGDLSTAIKYLDGELKLTKAQSDATWQSFIMGAIKAEATALGFGGLFPQAKPTSSIPSNFSDYQKAFRSAQGADASPSGGSPTGGLRAGILAGLYAESGLNPNAYNPAGGGQGAHGIGQWRGERFNQLKSFASARHSNWNDLTTQLAFVMWELSHTKSGAASAISGEKTETGALDKFIRLYESPAKGHDTLSDIRRGLQYLSRGGGGAAVAAGGAQITIGQITIQTAAKDAQGIAKAIGGALRGNLVQQANAGLVG